MTDRDVKVDELNYQASKLLMEFAYVTHLPDSKRPTIDILISKYAPKFTTLLEATLEEKVLEGRIDELKNFNWANVAYRDEGDLQQFKVYTEDLHKLKNDRISALQKDLLDKDKKLQAIVEMSKILDESIPELYNQPKRGSK